MISLGHASDEDRGEASVRPTPGTARESDGEKQSSGVGTNQVWYEATAISNGSVDSQGAGQVLELGCTTAGAPVQCEWTIRMLLQSTDPLVSWAQDLFGDPVDAGVLAVLGFDYVLTDFGVPVGGETFGPAPDLLVDTGASAPAPDTVPPGLFTLVEFDLLFDFDGVDTADRAIRTVTGALGPVTGALGWTDDTGAAPDVQFGDNTVVEALPNVVLPNPVIVIHPILAIELCDDGVDNDGDSLIDCDDPDCAGDANCLPALAITCPGDLTVECDGSGNQGDLAGWLAVVSVADACDNLSITNDFVALSDECGETGSATVTWTAVDDCGRANCSARFTIEDTVGPSVAGVEEITVECDGSGNQDDLDTWLDGATVEDHCGEAVLSNDFVELSDECGETGSVTVTWTGTDACDNANTHTATIAIQDTVGPVLTLLGAAEMTLECGVDTYTEPGADASDRCDTTAATADIGGDVVDVATPGVYEVTYNATDDCDNEAEQLMRIVEVVDTLPPDAVISEMVEMWPPNHKYLSFRLSDCVDSVMDACEGDLDIDQIGTIVSIYSDEPEDGNSDGNTSDDIVILGDSAFKLRSERQGGGNGRVYGITFVVPGTMGERAEYICYFGVPHDQSGRSPVDDGPAAGYSVP